jgi:hypothetical protein
MPFKTILAACLTFFFYLTSALASPAIVSPQNAYSVSGTVRFHGQGLASVWVKLGARSAYTNAQGIYSFDSVQNGSYTLTASRASYSITTDFSNPVLVNGADVPDRDFTAVGSFFISGTVKRGTVALPGVIVSTGELQATTGSNGSYIIWVPSGSYTLTASLEGYNINPNSFNNPVVVDTASLGNKNFNAVLIVGSSSSSSSSASIIQSSTSSSQPSSSPGSSSAPISSSLHSSSSLPSSSSSSVSSSLSSAFFSSSDLSSSFSSVSSSSISLSSFSSDSSDNSSSSGDPTFPVPQLDCVDNNLDGTFTAHFGYANDWGHVIQVPIGSQNKFLPAPQDRGQPTIFLEGLMPNQVALTFDGSPLTWVLGDNAVTASYDSELCNPQPDCDAGGPYIVTCNGDLAAIHLNASGSADPRALPLSYQWINECQDSQLFNDTNVAPLLKLQAPLQGQEVDCQVRLIVSNGRTVSDCAAQVIATACSTGCEGIVDLCGVCNGDNSCLDCAGVPYGGASADRCGVCGGDGGSCLNCLDTDISSDLIFLNGLVSRQGQLILKAEKKLERSNRHDARLLKRLRKIRATALNLTLQQHSALALLPQNVQSCLNTDFCTPNDQLPRLRELDLGSKKTGKLAKGLTRLMSGQLPAAKKLQKAEDKLVSDFSTRILEIPRFHSECP